MRTLNLLVLLPLVALVPACATTTDNASGAVGDRPEPTTGTRITRRDRESDVKVMSREEFERARSASGGTVVPPRN